MDVPITSPLLQARIYTSEAVSRAVMLAESNGRYPVKFDVNTTGWTVFLTCNEGAEQMCKQQLLELLNEALAWSLEQRLEALC